MRKLTIMLCAVGMLTTGCWSMSVHNPADAFANRVADSAADRVGDEIGKSIAASLLANNPALMYSYTMGVYGLLFYQGGYYLPVQNYEQGQWTRWTSQEVEQGQWFERTLLRRFDDGQEWWRVETRQTDENGETAVVITEALMSAADEAGRRRILRMRALLPGQEQPQEIAITEQDSRSWVFHDNRALTKESMEGMKVGSETIETQAGSFTADHLRTAHGGSGAIDWWISEEVPGGLLRYSTTDAEAEATQVVELVAYGDGQTESKLGIELTPAADEPADAPAGEAAEEAGDEA